MSAGVISIMQFKANSITKGNINKYMNLFKHLVKADFISGVLQYSSLIPAHPLFYNHEERKQYSLYY